MSKSTKIKIGETIVSVTKINEEDYICLTDMARFKDADRTNYIIQNWMRVRSTIEFLGLWEQLHNESFKGIEFDAFKNNAGSNSFSLTPKKWIETTNATGIISKSGRYGGTYAHKPCILTYIPHITKSRLISTDNVKIFDVSQNKN
jgi:hypothetical protein